MQEEMLQTTTENYTLDDMDRRIMQIKIQHPGISDGEIGELFKLDRTTVNRRRNKPAFKKAMEDWHLDIFARLKRMGPKALRVFEQFLDNPKASPYVRYKIGRDVLSSINLIKLAGRAADEGEEGEQGGLEYYDENGNLVSRIPPRTTKDVTPEE